MNARTDAASLRRDDLCFDILVGRDEPRGVDMTKKYWHLYADESGESHVEQLETELEVTDFMPPAKPVLVSAPTPALDCRYLVIVPDWEGDFHPAPSRQIQTLLRGVVETETTDGTQVRFEAGDVILLEDTTGRGHRSRVLSDGAELLAVRLR